MFMSLRNQSLECREIRNIIGFPGGSATLCLCMDVSHLARSCEREVRAWWRCGTGVGAHV